MLRSQWWFGFATIGLVVSCAGGSGSADGPAEPVRVSFESPLNLIVLTARIGGEGPFRFFLDCGATGTVIDMELAKRLGLDTTRPRTGRGTVAGSRVTSATVKGGVDFEVAPGFDVHVDRVIAAPFTEATDMMMGESYDGIFGSAFFSQHVIEIDYIERTLVFHDPSRYTYDGEGAELKLQFSPEIIGLPYVDASLVNGDRRLDGIRMYVDSGGQTMGTASVATRRQWDALVTPENRIVDVLGVTGLSNDPEGTTHDAFMTQMDRLILGPFEFEKPVVHYSAGGAGIAAMGATILRRFDVVFDYERNRMILEPNENFDTSRLTDQSGLMLVASTIEEAFEVMFVGKRTPAEEAGLKRGDVLRAIDGVAVREIRLNDARLMFSRSGTFRLDVLREGQEREVLLETRWLFED